MWNRKNTDCYKAAKEHFTIGELKKIYGYGVDSLRYFEKKGLLHPIRGENNYRYYHGEEFWTLNIIRSLRNAGLSVDEIGNYLENRTLDSTKEILNKTLDDIEAQIGVLHRTAESIRRQIDTIDTVDTALTGLFTVIRCPARRIILMEKSYSANDEYAFMKFELMEENYHGKYYSVIGDNRVGSVISMDRILEGDYTTYDGLFLLDPNGPETIPEGNYISILYRGRAPQNDVYIPMMLDYAQRNGLKIVGPFLELIWLDMHASRNSSELATELQALLADN